MNPENQLLCFTLLLLLKRVRLTPTGPPRLRAASQAATLASSFETDSSQSRVAQESSSSSSSSSNNSNNNNNNNKKNKKNKKCLHFHVGTTGALKLGSSAAICMRTGDTKIRVKLHLPQ